MIEGELNGMKRKRGGLKLWIKARNNQEKMVKENENDLKKGKVKNAGNEDNNANKNSKRYFIRRQERSCADAGIADLHIFQVPPCLVCRSFKGK